MKSPARILLTALLLCVASTAFAQTPTAIEAEPAEKPPPQPGWALGLGGGIAQTDQAGEGYWSANLRHRLGSSGEQGESAAPKEGLQAYVEGEVGYWKGDSSTVKDKDLMVGLNLIGVVPTRVADLFMGIGFGAHFTESDFVAADLVDVSETRFGGNAQFGVEVKITPKVGIFGGGRLDFLSGELNRQQNKIWGGLRFYF